MNQLSLQRFMVSGLFVFFALLYVVDSDSYDRVLDEDGPVEWLTFLCLMTAATLAWRIARRLRGSGDVRRWFFIAFCLGSLLAGLSMIDEPTGYEEEIGEFLFSVCFVLLMLSHLNETEARELDGG